MQKQRQSITSSTTTFLMTMRSLLITPGGPTTAVAAPPEAPPAPSASVKTAAIGKAKEAHKRQISQAIPRSERDNGELSRPEAAPASSRSTQGGTQEGTRKSVRARKSQKRAIRIAAIGSVHVNCTAQSRVTLIHCIAHQLLVNLVAAVLAMYAPPGQERRWPECHCPSFSIGLENEELREEERLKPNF